MNLKTLHAFSMLGVFALVSASFVPESQARTVMASAGRAVDAADAGCFGLFFSSMTNKCSVPKTLETSLAIDAGGTYTVTVNAWATVPGSYVGCQAWSTDKAAYAFQNSGSYKYTSGWDPQDLVLNSISVPFRGGMFVDCTVSPSGRVHTINW